MKKTVKIFSLIMVILMLMSVFSLSAFGFENDYMTIECPENYDEDDWSTEDGFYVDVYFNEYKLDENGEEYYTDNSVNIYATACWDDTLETYYDEETLDSLVEYTEDSASQITSKTMYYTTFGGYDAVAYDVYYTYTGSDENGKRIVEDRLYSEIVVVSKRTSITMDFDIWEAEDLLVQRNEMAELFLEGITLNTEKIAEAERGEKSIVVVILAVIIGGAIIGFIVVIVFIIHSTKKSKNNQVYINTQPQMYNPYANMVPKMVNNQENAKAGETSPINEYANNQKENI